MIIINKVDGLKGPTWLMLLTSFDVPKGISPEYMHCACLGVSKLMISLWTNTTRCKQTPHDIHISNIRTPTEITRKPRGLGDVQHWKGRYNYNSNNNYYCSTAMLHNNN